MKYEALPGGDVIRQGLADLEAGDETVAALLVSIGAPRLRRAGVPVPESTFPDPEHRLYLRLAAEHSDSAHSRYNAWIRRLVSFERSARCAQTPAVRQVTQETVPKAKLLKLYEPSQDSLRFHYLGRNWRRRVEPYGAKIVLDPEVPIIA